MKFSKHRSWISSISWITTYIFPPPIFRLIILYFFQFYFIEYSRRRFLLLKMYFYAFILGSRFNPHKVRINLNFFPPSSHQIYVCFCPVGLSLLWQHYQQVLWVLKSLLSPGLDSWQLEFKSLIISILGFDIYFVAWSGV